VLAIQRMTSEAMQTAIPRVPKEMPAKRSNDFGRRMVHNLPGFITAR